MSLPAPRLCRSDVRHALLGTCLVWTLVSGSSSEAAQTGVTGLSFPFENSQPSLALNFLMPTVGDYPMEEGDANARALGMLRTFTYSHLTYDQPSANGQQMFINQNPALFSLLGTTFGGNGINTFALPDLRGRTIVGAGPYAEGQVLGSAATTLTINQMPAHSHPTSLGLPTSVAGAGASIDNLQPSLAMKYLIAVDAPIPGTPAAASSPTFAGMLVPYAGWRIPGGFATAEGQLLSIQDHVSLYSVIGTTYGGDGQTTFALPDLRGRTLIGAGTGPGLTPRALGSVTGTEEYRLVPDQVALHGHSADSGVQVGVTGGSFSLVDTMQPSLAINYMISVQGSFPSPECCTGLADTALGEVVAFAGGAAPEGWMLADGRLLFISQYQALFALLGTTFGGDGRVTFALPDLRGRTLVGSDERIRIGEQFGTEYASLFLANLPAHAHTLPVPEPGTWWLLFAGLAVMVPVAARRVH